MIEVSAQARSRLKQYVMDATPEDVVDRYARLPKIAEISDFGDLDRNIVVVDTETTGLSFNHDELIQIAAARLEQGNITDWYVTFVQPGKSIPEDVAHLTNIHDEDLIGAPDPNEALEGLVAFAGDAKIIAHNANFDRTFTTKYPGGYPLLENAWYDSLDLSRIALPRLKSHRLIDLVHTFDTPVSTHRADADVAATCAVYRILLAAVASMPKSLICEIAHLASSEEWRTAPVFQYFERALTKGTIAHTASGGIDLFQTLMSEDGVSAEVSDKGNENLAEPDTAAIDKGDKDLAESDTDAPEIGKQKTSHRNRRLFSLAALRSMRVDALPPRKAKRDARMVLDDPSEMFEYPTQEEIDTAFSAEGLMGSIYDRYEARSEQVEMAEAIGKAFEASENLVVEAGTGVGKSMGYLVPSALMAKKNDVAVGIATKTNTLLDQLVYKELPSLAGAFAEKFPEADPLTFASLKGYSHYPCLRKISHVVDEGAGMKEVAGTACSQAPAIAGLLSYIEQTEFDDMDGLKIDYRLLPRYAITTTSNECLHRKCPFFGKLCFTHGARRRAESADILVTNHSLLFCDLAADGGLLPPARHWVIDEAHDAEPEARRAFTQKVDSDELMRIAAKVSSTSGSRNVFTRAERRVDIPETQMTLFYSLTAKAKSCGEAFAHEADAYAHAVKALLYYDTNGRNKSYEHIDLWINAEVRNGERFASIRLCERALVDASDKLIKASQDLVGYLDGVENAAEIEREIASAVMDVREMRNAAELIFETVPDNYVYHAELDKKQDRLIDVVEAQLLDVGTKMNETLYARTCSVVFASATLSIDGKFDTFNQAMGLNQAEESHAVQLQLDSSFDFDNNMIIYVARDMPEPNNAAYLKALEKLLIGVHRAQGGSMLTLFTNRREMETCYDVVRPALKSDDLRLVCQKWGVSVKGLRDDFLADETLSLFALKSFWQGFDAPGATLKGVVIPKLPFARPTDPLYCERQLRDDRAWFHYVLPQAVIETKQAAGRLIRKADDTGVLVLADKRLVSKRYGRTFLNSLQSKTIRICTCKEIIEALEAINAR